MKDARNIHTMPTCTIIPLTPVTNPSSISCAKRLGFDVPCECGKGASTNCPHDETCSE
jgi:hypothetical protein